MIVIFVCHVTYVIIVTCDCAIATNMMQYLGCSLSRPRDVYLSSRHLGSKVDFGGNPFWRENKSCYIYLYCNIVSINDQF